jgi:hypothetical protein
MSNEMSEGGKKAIQFIYGKDPKTPATLEDALAIRAGDKQIEPSVVAGAN